MKHTHEIQEVEYIEKTMYVLLIILNFFFTTCLYSIKNNSKPKGFDLCDNPVPIVIKNASFDLRLVENDKNNLRTRNQTNSIIRDRLLCSKLFREVDLGRSKEGYYLELTSNSHSVARPIFRFLLVFSHLSLTILPGYDEQNYTLNLNLFRDGAFYKRYKSERIMDILFWFPFLVIKNDDKALDEILELLVADVIEQMKMDLVKEQKKNLE
jgi:hypothetical protein